MASASGCITLSLALHATLLWGAAGHERPVEHHVAVDTVTDAIALGFESGGLAPDEGAGTPGAAESAPPGDDTDAVPAAGAPPVQQARPVRRLTERAAPKPIVERQEKTPTPEPTEASPAPPVASPSPSPTPAPTPDSSPSALASSGSASLGVPGIVSALPVGGHGLGGGSAADAHGARVGSARGDGSDGDAARRAALLDYGRRVRTRIAERREYPYAARRARLHGTVCLRIELAASGRLIDAAPTCGNSLGPLAKAALAAVAKASPFPPLPAALGQRLTLDVPVIFELED